MIPRRKCEDCTHLRLSSLGDIYVCAVDVCTYEPDPLRASATCEDCPASLAGEPCEGQCGRALPPGRGTTPEPAPPEEPGRSVKEGDGMWICDYAEVCPLKLRFGHCQVHHHNDRCPKTCSHAPEGYGRCKWVGVVASVHPALQPPEIVGRTVDRAREVVRIRVTAEALEGYQAPNPEPTPEQARAMYHIALAVRELAEAMGEDLYHP